MMENISNAKIKMQLLWVKDKNEKVFNKTFDSVTVKDKNNAFWRCDFNNPNCSYTVKSPEQVYQAIKRGGAVCTDCKGTNIDDSVLMNSNHEHIEKYWHYERNRAMGYYPNSKSAMSNDYIFVRCLEHNWGIREEQKQRCADFTHGRIACPECNGKQATIEKNLKELFPIYAEELHPEFNAELILPSTSKKYPFWCSKCEMFYLIQVRLRTAQNQGCPNHNTSYKFSKSEQLLKFILNEIIGDFSKKYIDITWKSGQRMEVDLYEPTLRIGIEFDGKHHQEKIQIKRDQTKNDMLHKHRKTIGMSLFIRIRERGLPELNYHENQVFIICGKHRNDFTFLIPAIQKLITLINNGMQLNLKSYSDDELLTLIKKYIPKLNLYKLN